MATGPDKQLTGEGGLRVHVVTPYGQLVDEQTDAITAPGEEGQFELLPGHIPFLTSLHSGVLILGESRSRRIFAVSRGYLRVDLTGDVEVLVERAEEADAIDLADAQADRKAAASELDHWTGEQDADWKNLRTRLDWAEARLDAHGASSH